MSDTRGWSLEVDESTRVWIFFKNLPTITDQPKRKKSQTTNSSNNIGTTRKNPSKRRVFVFGIMSVSTYSVTVFINILLFLFDSFTLSCFLLISQSLYKYNQGPWLDSEVRHNLTPQLFVLLVVLEVTLSRSRIFLVCLKKQKEALGPSEQGT